MTDKTDLTLREPTRKQTITSSFGNNTSASQGAVSGAAATLLWGCAVHYFGVEPPPTDIYGASIVLGTWLWQLLVK